MKKNDKIKTGISGLDELTGGGLPRGSLTLLTGTCGTGKTTLALQFIHTGALEGEAGVYVTFEESPENLKNNTKIFGWDIESLEKKNKITFIKYDPFHAEDILELLAAAIRKTKAKRVVIDSISALALYIRDIPEIRRVIFNLSLMLHKLGCTSIIISEILSQQDTLSRFNVEEFVADGVIVLYYFKTDSTYSRSITIWKMRGTEHSHKLHPYMISKKGIVVYPKEEAFARKR